MNVAPLPARTLLETPESAIKPALLMVTGAVALRAPPLTVVAQVEQAISPAAEMVTGAVAARAPPFVVVAQVAQVMFPLAAVIVRGLPAPVAVTAGVPDVLPHVMVTVPAIA